jgi:SAM-dependent methyltransferase
MAKRRRRGRRSPPRGERQGAQRLALRVMRLGAPVPYLAGAVREAFDSWLAAAVSRHTRDLEFREVRKGAQALSSLYVERREGVDLAARAIEGRGKRAAVATYYAPLHFLTVYHALSQIGVNRLGPVSELYDLGCGTGAASAAVAQALGGAPRVVGVDRSGFLLAEARRTWTAFGLPAGARRGRLPGAAPRPVAGHLWVLGWAVNEMDERAQADLLALLLRALEGGVRLLVFEPLAGPATPCWPAWARALAARGVLEGAPKVRVALPEWLALLDRAAGLDHRVLGARLLAGPLADAPPAS